MNRNIDGDPLLPYLAEIVARPECRGIILSGGFGLRLKQHYLGRLQDAAGGQPITLIEDVPDARATLDLDLFLNVNIWIDLERAHALGAALKGPLGYETAIHSWQFRKPMTGAINGRVKLDLMARGPRDDEHVNVKGKRGKPQQVGREMGTGISGWHTPEAFAIDDSPISVTFLFGDENYSVLVPHPYAWMQMKIRAAFDWLQEQRGLADLKLTATGDRVRLKHVYDVYVLTAMLTQGELAECTALAQNYANHEEARKTRAQAIELYGSADAPGTQAVEAYSRRYMGTDLTIDRPLFWHEGLKVALGIDAE
jgi:hypothetical protein